MIFFGSLDIKNNASDFGRFFSEHKVAHIISDNDLISADSTFRELSKQAGIPLIYEEDPITGQININKWTEIKFEPHFSENTYKSSNKYQPLHTDYGYFSFEMYASFFYCVEQAQFGGATTFIDADKVVEILSQVNKKLFDFVLKEKIHFGRNDNPLANNRDFILQKDNVGWKINWNYYRALSDEKNIALVEDFKDFLDTYIEKSGELTELKLKPGEGVFFHDRRVLHGRNSFVGNRHLNKGAITKELPAEIKNLILMNS
jgi:alpha-ketoglutarate-dependent taurine dioxygenase